MKTTKKFIFAGLVFLLGLGLALIGGNRGEKITDTTQLESGSLFSVKTATEATKIAVPKDVLNSLPDIKISWLTWGQTFVIQTFDLNGGTCVLIAPKPIWGKNIQTSVRAVARSDSAELDKIVSDFEQSSGKTTSGYVLVSQTAFLQFVGSVIIVFGALLYFYFIFLDIKNKKLRSW